MFYLDHCKTTIKEQAQVLWHYQSEVTDLDYEFIRNHALSVYQFSDHIVTLDGMIDRLQTLGDPIDHSQLSTLDHCRRSLREQIDMLWRYLDDGKEVDYDFVRTHALYIIQFSDHLRRAQAS